jgi:hypothetical protein
MTLLIRNLSQIATPLGDSAVRGAAMLVTVPALLANPAGLLLAIPAAWRFVSQVMDAFITPDRIAGGSNDGE